jgi:hypothetical protein
MCVHHISLTNVLPDRSSHLPKAWSQSQSHQGLQPSTKEDQW